MIKFWQKIKQFFFSRKNNNILIDSDDPLQTEVIQRCWKTKKGIIGNRDKDGNIKIKEFDIKQ